MTDTTMGPRTAQTKATSVAPRSPSVEHPDSPPVEVRRSPTVPSMGGWLGSALVASAIVAATVWQFRHLTVYLDSDSGHYLADAQALLGHGVRESRHLPGLPLLLAALRPVLSDLVAVRVAMALLLLGLFGAFRVFVRGRVGSATAELAGCFFFVCTPLVAEAVGWYGAAMLMGLALSLVAMRLLDAAITEPRVLTVVGAGLTVGAVGLTHPFSLVFLFQTAVLAFAVLGLMAVRRAWPGPGWRDLGLRRRLLAGLGTVGIAIVAVLPALPFYRSLSNPVSFRTDATQLRLVPLWAFREDPVLWIALLLAGVLLLSSPSAAGGEAGRAQHHLRVWAAAAGVVALANVVVSGGNGSYVTRNLYALPIVLGTGASLGVSRLLQLRLPSASGRRGIALAAAVVLTAAAGTRVMQLYVERLRASLPYYNTLSEAEYDAVRWLHGHSGSVLVTAKFEDQNAGTLYAWMVEGLAEMRAMGPGERYLYLIQRAVDESEDAQRVLSGSHVRENATLRVGTTPGTAAPVHVEALVAGTWYPVLSLSDPGSTAAGEALSAAARGIAVRPSLDGSHAAFDLSLPPPIGSLVLTGGTAGSPGAVVTGRASGRLTYRDRIGDRSVAVAIDAMPPDGLDAHSMPRPRSRWSDHLAPTQLEIRAVRPAEGPWTIHVDLDGLDRQRPEAAVTWTDADLVQARSFTYVYTWTGSPQAAALAGRPCFRTAMANREVTILSIDRQCMRSPERSGG